jgi:hypothetical protein
MSKGLERSIEHYSHHRPTDREQVINKVLKHIEIDIACGDLTAIEELLNNIPTEYLVGYLPEGTV